LSIKGLFGLEILISAAQDENSGETFGEVS